MITENIHKHILDNVTLNLPFAVVFDTGVWDPEVLFSCEAEQIDITYDIVLSQCMKAK